MKPNNYIKIRRRDLTKLVFWASWGIGRSRGGSGMAVRKIMLRLNKRHKLQTKIAHFGEYLPD